MAPTAILEEDAYTRKILNLAKAVYGKRGHSVYTAHMKVEKTRAIKSFESGVVIREETYIQPIYQAFVLQEDLVTRTVLCESMSESTAVEALMKLSDKLERKLGEMIPQMQLKEGDVLD